jgi:hypothetical protein
MGSFTQQRSIVNHAMVKNVMPQDVFRIPDANTLGAIIISSDGGKMVILATPDDSEVEIYGALVSDIANAKKLATSTKIRYDPMHNTAFMRESGNEMRICITSLSDKKTHSFNLGRLLDSFRESTAAGLCV